MEGFVFSLTSQRRLEGVKPELVKITNRALYLSTVDFGIASGVRTMAEQQELVATGKSQTLNSKHLTGDAIDFIAIDPETKQGSYDELLMTTVAEAFFRAAGEDEVGINWGGHWKTFVDMPHIELRST